VKKRIRVINGPNLNLLGIREPEVYGNMSLEQLNDWLVEQCPEAEFNFYQSNSESDLIDALHAAGREGAAVIINPGGYSHNSVVLLDAIRAIGVPVIEVHLSNIHSRERFRNRTMTGRAAKAVISGMGPHGYLAAARYFIKNK
jgi:3-dehydroquinate dehydratase II